MRLRSSSIKATPSGVPAVPLSRAWACSKVHSRTPAGLRLPLPLTLDARLPAALIRDALQISAPAIVRPPMSSGWLHSRPRPQQAPRANPQKRPQDCSVPPSCRRSPHRPHRRVVTWTPDRRLLPEELHCPQDSPRQNILFGAAWPVRCLIASCAVVDTWHDRLPGARSC
jgi:hypothetical protein